MQATCPECGARIQKFVSPANLSLLTAKADHNTSEDLVHECSGSMPARIVKTSPCNERLIYAWQVYAGRYDEKTVDRHLAAIRAFESSLEGKRFTKLTTADVARFRKALKQSLTADVPKSKSSVRHTASHLGAFLSWLIVQPSGVRLPRDLPSYVILPLSAYAGAIEQTPRLYPSIEEAERMLKQLSGDTIEARRNRALFSIVFLGALRANTAISLLRRHVDLDHRIIRQDGTVSRTKNGKSLEIKWFPIPQVFGQVVSDWCAEMDAAGLQPDDALFPALKHLGRGEIQRQTEGSPIPVMTSTHAVASVFAEACLPDGPRYVPHSAKHTIAAERDRLSLTASERKAWSENMGHENEQITDRHYAKLSRDERFDLIEGINETEVITGTSELDMLMKDKEGREFVLGLARLLSRNANGGDC